MTIDQLIRRARRARRIEGITGFACLIAVVVMFLLKWHGFFATPDAHFAGKMVVIGLAGVGLILIVGSLRPRAIEHLA